MRIQDQSRAPTLNYETQLRGPIYSSKTTNYAVNNALNQKQRNVYSESSSVHARKKREGGKAHQREKKHPWPLHNVPWADHGTPTKAKAAHSSCLNAKLLICDRGIIQIRFGRTVMSRDQSHDVFRSTPPADIRKKLEVGQRKEKRNRKWQSSHGLLGWITRFRDWK